MTNDEWDEEELIELKTEEDFETEGEYDLYLLTLMIKVIDPDVDEGEVYDILYYSHMGEHAWNTETALEVGEKILATKEKGPVH